MRKGLQIVLLAVLFAASGVAGYFVGKFVFKKPDQPPPPPIRSSIPEYQSISERKKDSRGQYEFNAEYSTETGDRLTYSLYIDADCLNHKFSNNDGRFISVPGTESGTYYLKVTNISTGDASVVRPVDGFNKVNLIEKLSEEDLYLIMREGIQNAEPYTNQRISPKHSLIVTNLRDDDNNPEHIKNVYSRLRTQNWEDVKIVSTPKYDSENRLTILEIEVIYPQP